MDEDTRYSWQKVYDLSEEDQLSRLAERETHSSSRIIIAAFCLALAAIWILNFQTDWLSRWGAGWHALESGQYDTILLHMFAHVGLVHLAMNCAVLWVFGTEVIDRFGRLPFNVFRFVVFYLMAGVAGLAAYLVLHPYGVTPMVGASGAICGLVGLLWRVSPDDGAILPFWSKRTRILMKRFAVDHLPWILTVTLPALLIGSGGGIAWEAHLGGLIFGLWAGPKFLPWSPDVSQSS